MKPDSQPSSIRIVQISDMHVTEVAGERLYGVESGESLTQVLNAISQLKPRPAFIVATGDLVDKASIISYQRLGYLFSQQDLPVYVICGNHDNSGLIDQALVNEQIHHRDFIDLENWRLVFLDSTIANRNHGIVTASALDKLKRNLRESPHEFALVALHHPTIRSCPSAGCQLHDSENFIEFLKAHSKVHGVIAGHTHLASDNRQAELAQFTSPSTFAQVAHADSAEPEGLEDFLISHEFDFSRLGYRILDLYSNGEIKSRVEWLNAVTAT